MKINEIFEKNINRDVIVSVKVSVSDKKYLVKLINEFSFTSYVLKNLSEFFSFYNSQLENPKSNAVLISGKFGVGKTYFLRILSLLLDKNIEIKNETPLNYVKKTDKLNEGYLEMIEKNQNISRDVISFNFDSKFYSNNKSILYCLFNEFNKIRGFCDFIPFVAYFEKQLCLKNMFDDFKLEFKRIYGEEWENARNEFFFIHKYVIKSAINIGFLYESEAEEWFNNVEENYELSVDEFCEEINHYCEITGNNHHIIYFIDELVSSLSINEKLMIEFKEIMEEISNKCMGNIFIITTGQSTLKEIDSNLSELQLPIFSNIFEIELFFNLENIIEAIKLSSLSKKSDVEYQLISDFNNNVELFNSPYFENFNIKKNDFVDCYPFLNYQFKLFIEIFENCFNRITFRGHIDWAEGPNYFNHYHGLLNEFADNEYGSLISFNLFFEVLDLYLGIGRIFNKFNENINIDSFDLELLKVIFMLDFSDEINSTSKNITALMISNLKDDPFELNKKIDKSLERLLKENLIEKKEDSFNCIYEYFKKEFKIHNMV